MDSRILCVILGLLALAMGAPKRYNSNSSPSVVLSNNEWTPIRVLGDSMEVSFSPNDFSLEPRKVMSDKSFDSYEKSFDSYEEDFDDAFLAPTALVILIKIQK